MNTIEQLTASPVGTFEPESWDDFVEGWHHLNRLADGVTWYRGQLVSKLKGKYGEKAVEKFAEEVGYSPAHLYRYAQVYEAFGEISSRYENLAFKHYKAVLTLDSGEAEGWLEKADEERWSARELERQVTETKGDEAEVIQLPSEKREPRPDPDTCPKCGRTQPLHEFRRRNGSFGTWCNTCVADSGGGNPELSEGTPHTVAEMLAKHEENLARLRALRDQYGADMDRYAQGQLAYADETVNDLHAIMSDTLTRAPSWTS